MTDYIYSPGFMTPIKPSKKAKYLTGTIMDCYKFEFPEVPYFDNLVWYRWENIKTMDCKVYDKDDKMIHDYKFFKDKNDYIYCIDKVENKEWRDPKYNFKVIDNYYVIREEK